MFIVSGISVYTLGLVAVFCFLWGSFVFYKKTEESHFEQEAVLDTIVLSAFWAFIVGRLGFVLFNMADFYKHWTRIFLLVNYPGMNRWGILLGLVLGVLLLVRKKKGKYLDYLDLATLGYFSGVAFFWLGINFISFYYQNIVIALFNFGVFLWFWKLEKTYRLISWYRASKSFAKSGFVSGFGLLAMGFGYLLERALYRQIVLTDILLSLGLLICGVALVYIRSGRILVDDINLLKPWNKKSKK